MSTDRAMKRAHNRVQRAVKRGLIKRPDACELCGKVPEKTAAGRSGIQGHHHKGYQFPLDVQWVCGTCHSREDKLRHGEGRPGAKFTEQQIREIRLLHKKGWGYRRLARHFSRSLNTMRDITRGKAWAHVRI